MLFSPKIKGYFVERNDHSWLIARTSSAEAPFVIEDLREVPLDDAEGLKSALLKIQKNRPQGNYLNSTCGIYPLRRIARRASLEPKRLKEDGYLSEVCVQQLRIESEQFILAILNASDGSEFDTTRPGGREVLFCGMPIEDVVVQQDSLLNSGVYPTRLELGTISSLGAALNYLKYSAIKTPTLLLEIGSEVTHSFILSENGVEASRPIPYGLEAMIPVVQKKLSIKDEESARKLFLSNAFDFTDMGPELVQRLLKELQSSIGFFEVQTGQSIAQLLCLGLPPKLGWIETTIAGTLGIGLVKLSLPPWLKAHGITLSELASSAQVDGRWFGLIALMLRQNNSVAANAPFAEKKE
jgi:hypothetical protein